MKGLTIILLVFVSLHDTVNASGKKYCGYKAKCDNGKCQCRPSYKGNPYFACYPPDKDYFCTISHDPVITGFDNQNASLVLPVASSPAYVKVWKRYWVFFARVDTFTKPTEGKFFINGIQIYLIIRSVSGALITRTYKVIGKVRNNEYMYYIKSRTGTGAWQNDYVIKDQNHYHEINKHPCHVNFKRKASKFLLVNVTCMNLVVGIRTHNPKAMKAIPGIFISVEKDNGLTLYPLPGCLCNNATYSQNLDDLVDQHKLQTRRQYMTLNGLAYGPNRYQGAYRYLPSLRKTLRKCNVNRLSGFMRNADFLFDFEKYVNCADNAAIYMNITHQIVHGYCHKSRANCMEGKNAIEDKCSHLTSNEKMNEFLIHGCDDQLNEIP